MTRPAFRRLRIDQLRVPETAIRKGRERLDELAVSVDELGVVVPLVVRAPVDGLHDVIAGVGRLEALQRNGAGPDTTVPVVIVDVDDGEATLLSLVENMVREDMRPIDEAETARVLVKEYGYTQQRVARALGMTQPAVSQWLAVYELDARVVAALRSGKIGMNAARALLPLRGNGKAQRGILLRMTRDGLSAGQVAALVAGQTQPRGITPIRYTVKNAGRVEAKTTRAGRLRVVIEADDRAGLHKLIATLKKRLPRRGQGE